MTVEVSQGIPDGQANESCTFQIAEACRRRKGIVEVTRGYLVIIDGKPGLVCAECRAIVNERKEA